VNVIANTRISGFTQYEPSIEELEEEMLRQALMLSLQESQPTGSIVVDGNEAVFIESGDTSDNSEMIGEPNKKANSGATGGGSLRASNETCKDASVDITTQEEGNQDENKLVRKKRNGVVSDSNTLLG